MVAVASQILRFSPRFCNLLKLSWCTSKQSILFARRDNCQAEAGLVNYETRQILLRYTIFSNATSSLCSYIITIIIIILYHMMYNDIIII